MINGELGQFIRTRREAVHPSDVGLPQGPRRRTPGLRREELATLAGISVDYLVRLEQGRDQNPSPQVLSAIATALQMNVHDLEHLFALSSVSAGAAELLCPARLQTSVTVRPTVESLLRQLEPAPAFVMNRRLDMLAWNNTFDALARPLGIMDRAEPNLIMYAFTDERARAAFPDWEEFADDLVAMLHQLRWGDPSTETLVKEISETAGNSFSDRWKQRPLGSESNGVRAVDHPTVGRLRLAFETLDLPGPDEQRIIVYMPADQATASGLDRLVGRSPGSLHAIPAS